MCDACLQIRASIACLMAWIKRMVLYGSSSAEPFEGSFMPALYNQVVLCVARHDPVLWGLARIARFAHGRVCDVIATWLSSE